MNTPKSSQVILPKKAYKRPNLKRLGSVKKLTLKLGSAADAQNGTGFNWYYDPSENSPAHFS